MNLLDAGRDARADARPQAPQDPPGDGWRRAPAPMPMPPPRGGVRAAGAHHWATLAEAGTAAGLWFLYACYRAGGRGLYRLLTIPVATYFALARGVRREASIEYLERVGVLDRSASRTARLAAVIRHFRCFADVLLDKFLVWTDAIDLHDAVVDVEPRFDAALRQRRGGIIVVAHCGNLEALRAIGRRLPALRLTILVHTPRSQHFARVLARIAPPSAAGLLQVTELTVGAAVEFAARVDAGEWLVIAADRVPVSGIERTVAVDFLGAAALFPAGPWILAAALACPVYWLACSAGKRQRYRVTCRQLHERLVLPRATRAAALRDAVAGFAAQLESACREQPYEWFNFFPFWRSAQLRRRSATGRD